MLDEGEPVAKADRRPRNVWQMRASTCLGSVGSLDRSTERVHHGSTMAHRFAYDKLLLATGASPRRLPLADDSSHRCVYLRTFDDALAHSRAYLSRGARASPSSAAASSASNSPPLRASAAARSRVIEAQPRILMRGVPAEIAAIIQARA